VKRKGEVVGEWMQERRGRSTEKVRVGERERRREKG
jgi:hypothetical protein